MTISPHGPTDAGALTMQEQRPSRRGHLSASMPRTRRAVQGEVLGGGGAQLAITQAPEGLKNALREGSSSSRRGCRAAPRSSSLVRTTPPRRRRPLTRARSSTVETHAPKVYLEVAGEIIERGRHVERPDPRGHRALARRAHFASFAPGCTAGAPSAAPSTALPVARLTTARSSQLIVAPIVSAGSLDESFARAPPDRADDLPTASNASAAGLNLKLKVGDCEEARGRPSD